MNYRVIITDGAFADIEKFLDLKYKLMTKPRKQLKQEFAR